MGRVVISHADEAPVGALPSVTGVSAHGPIQTRVVIGGLDRPLSLLMHDMAPGAEIRWESPAVGHLVYVWSGEAEFGGRRLPTDAVAIVEHQGEAVLRSGPGGATLAHFYPREDASSKPQRAGGTTHVTEGKTIFNAEAGITFQLYADSACPTCAFWLHRSSIPEPTPDVGRHFHNEDEIIMVRRGGIRLGRRTLGPGSALAVDAETIYTFGVEPGGVQFVNFRPTDPYYVKVGPKNEPLHAPICERDFMYDTRLHGFGRGDAATADAYREAGLAVESNSPAPARTT